MGDTPHPEIPVSAAEAIAAVEAVRAAERQAMAAQRHRRGDCLGGPLGGLRLDRETRLWGPGPDGSDEDVLLGAYVAEIRAGRIVYVWYPAAGQ